MRAIVREAYGGTSVLRYEDRLKPEPKADEVCIRVRASSLNRADVYRLSGRPLPIRIVTGFWGPRVRGLGMDIAGEVVAVGSAVHSFRPGDAVVGEASMGETWADYACVRADALAPMVRAEAAESFSSTDFVAAATLPIAGITALQGLRDYGRLKAGQSELINGATGAVGTFAVQVAKALGAEVTGVCRSVNRQRVRDLGADHVIAYDEEDFTECSNLAGSFDVLFDGIMERPLRPSCRVLKKKGTYVAVGGPSGRWLGPIIPLLAALVQAPFVSQRVVSFTALVKSDDMATLEQWRANGVIRAAIDRVFDFAQIPEALEYQLHGRPWGKVAIRMNGDEGGRG